MPKSSNKEGMLGLVPPEKVSRRQVTLKTEVSTHQQAKLKNLVSNRPECSVGVTRYVVQQEFIE